ncbi:hypothetical protein I35_4313 [Burkholderia cenocepacia H111]|nr:hypothetical protein I35_4313 [Burkholderia cenocepacia H111]
MFRFDAGVGLRKRHAAGRPLVLRRRHACASVAHACRRIAPAMQVRRASGCRGADGRRDA